MIHLLTLKKEEGKVHSAIEIRHESSFSQKLITICPSDKLETHTHHITTALCDDEEVSDC